MTFEELYKGELSILLNSGDTSVLFTATRRKTALRQAEEEFVDLTECLIRQSTVACSCNTAEYDLNSSAVLNGSTDFIRWAKQGVEYHHVSSGGTLRTRAGDEFPRRDIPWLNRNLTGWRESTVTSELPRGYYERTDGGSLFLGLIDKPDVGSSETGKLLLPYVTRPAVMSNSTSEPFTVGTTPRADLRVYHKALPHYAAHKLLPLIGDKVGAAEQLQQFLGYVARYAQAQRPKGGTHVTMARSYYRDARGHGGSGDLSIDLDTRLGRRV